MKITWKKILNNFAEEFLKNMVMLKLYHFLMNTINLAYKIASGRGDKDP